MIESILEKTRKLWMRLALRGVHFQDHYERMERLYRLSDPWDMAGNLEQLRFVETNRLISKAFGSLGSILEVGCGEGHQSECLIQLCDQLTGIDVSTRAVDRASQRLPKAQFEVSTLESSFFARSFAPFDLVTAMEVLYYMADVEANIKLMEQLGHACFVTYCDKHAERLDSVILSRTGVTCDEFSYEGTRWMVRWWSSQSI